jgi:hypothetical protein
MGAPTALWGIPPNSPVLLLITVTGFPQPPVSCTRERNSAMGQGPAGNLLSVYLLHDHRQHLPAADPPAVPGMEQGPSERCPPQGRGPVRPRQHPAGHP